MLFFRKKNTKIFVWNISAVTNAVIDTLQKSKNTDVYYANSRLKVLAAKPVLIKTDGYEMLNEMKKIGIEYIFSNFEANSKGLIDIAPKYDFKAIGADYKSLKLEASKAYSKAIMDKYNITTPKYIILDNISELESYKGNIDFPVVIKADGYAKGLSAKRIDNYDELKDVAEKYLNGYFGICSQKIIIEQYINGKELSIQLALDGKTIKSLIPIKDYKKRNNNEFAPNTGGMGSFAPIDINSEEELLLKDLIKKLENLLKGEKHFYKGFMSINVIFSNNQLYLLEMNTRLGDSEGQVLLKMIDFELKDLFAAMWQGKLDKFNLKWKKGYAIAVNIINNDYPDLGEHKPSIISKESLNQLSKDDISIYFYNSVKETENEYITTSDRFLSLVTYGNSLEETKSKIYNSIKKLNAENIYYREDIGINAKV